MNNPQIVSEIRVKPIGKLDLYEQLRSPPVEVNPRRNYRVNWSLHPASVNLMRLKTRKHQEVLDEFAACVVKYDVPEIPEFRIEKQDADNILNSVGLEAPNEMQIIQFAAQSIVKDEITDTLTHHDGVMVAAVDITVGYGRSFPPWYYAFEYIDQGQCQPGRCLNLPYLTSSGSFTAPDYDGKFYLGLHKDIPSRDHPFYFPHSFPLLLGIKRGA